MDKSEKYLNKHADEQGQLSSQESDLRRETEHPLPNDAIKGGPETQDRLLRLADGRIEIEFARPLEATEISPEMLVIMGHRFGNQMKFDLAKRLTVVRVYPEDWFDVLRVTYPTNEKIDEFKARLSLSPKE